MMAIKWKSSKRFKPALILSRIDSARTVKSSGGASFSGFAWEECLPALHSMLLMPDITAEVDVSQIVWRALTKVREPLTPKNFLEAANSELNSLLAAKEESYRLLTSLSIDAKDIARSLTLPTASIYFLKNDYSKNYKSRRVLIESQRTGVEQEPATYCKVVVSLKAKSPSAAFAKGQYALDIVRAIWCLFSNPSMQISFGASVPKPINVIRTGSHHTLHLSDGSLASEALWYEPGYLPAKIHVIKKPVTFRKSTLYFLRQLKASSYQDLLMSAMVRYVRALDEADPNTSFIRLWSAIESLTTPDRADYEKLIQRCSFLFSEFEFHRQMLEHLREYRNGSIHADDMSEHARTSCYQLQLYFRTLLYFHLGNANFFQSLDEANDFLDTKPSKVDIARKIILMRKALKFLG